MTLVTALGLAMLPSATTYRKRHVVSRPDPKLPSFGSSIIFFQWRTVQGTISQMHKFDALHTDRCCQFPHAIGAGVNNNGLSVSLEPIDHPNLKRRGKRHPPLYYLAVVTLSDPQCGSDFVLIPA